MNLFTRVYIPFINLVNLTKFLYDVLQCNIYQSDECLYYYRSRLALDHKLRPNSINLLRNLKDSQTKKHQQHTFFLWCTYSTCFCSFSPSFWLCLVFIRRALFQSAGRDIITREQIRQGEGKRVKREERAQKKRRERKEVKTHRKRNGGNCVLRACW